MNSHKSATADIARAIRRLWSDGGSLPQHQQHAIARAALASFDHQFRNPIGELLLMREALERKIPSHVRAHRQLVRILRVLNFDPPAFALLGPEWPVRVGYWLSVHVLLTGILIDHMALQLGPVVTRRLKSILACFLEAQSFANEVMP